ncbi:lamin tail domain-containing protein, partial [Candidatus Bipolaricaulota bacterium]
AMSCVCIGVLIGGLGCLGNDLVISEVAWAGTAAGSSDEWIELQNLGDVAIELAGWHLSFGDALIPLGEAGEGTVEARTIILEAGAFLLLERTDDDSISDITADVLYKGALANAGVLIELRNPESVVVDSIVPLESGWQAGDTGDGDPPYCTMERTSLGGWVSNNGIIRNGADAEGNALNGTPGQPNSAEVLAQWAPLVELTFPNEAGSILSGTELISWVADDPNGTDSALSMAIFVSVNEDTDWILVIENIVNTGSFAWDTTAFASGGEYLLKIRASDLEGYIGEAVSPVFEIANGTE